MFISYTEDSPFWKEEQKGELLRRFTKELDLPRLGQSDPRPHWFHRDSTYLQMDSFGKSGVYIRGVTKLPEDELEKLEPRTSQIYVDVMNVSEDDLRERGCSEDEIDRLMEEVEDDV